ncbi:MAG: YbaN family protein [Alphaproteobacteria bacterium]|nr:YbaN family protein [Alphaproteobacteria bacterium]
MKPEDQRQERPDNLAHCTLRWGLFAFGWLNVGLGIIGIVVPGLPTTVFLIIALWAFSKSSDRFQRWLWEHSRFGPPIRSWHEHRVIPLKAKVLAAAMMSASFLYVTVYVADGWHLPALLAAVMVPAAAYILTRASVAPAEAIPETPEVS